MKLLNRFIPQKVKEKVVKNRKKLIVLFVIVVSLELISLLIYSISNIHFKIVAKLIVLVIGFIIYVIFELIIATLIVLVIGFIIYVIFKLIIATIKTSVKAGKEAYYAYESGEGIDRFIKGIQEDTPHAIVGMLTKIAKADGFISPFEDIVIRHNIDNLIDALKNTGMTSSELKRYYDSLIDTYEDAKNNNYGISYYANKVSNKSNQDLMHVIIQQLVLIGFIDGDGLSSKKESMIYEAANILGVSSYYVDEMIKTAEESSKESEKESSANFEKDPWEVLGVSKSATFEEVKRAYRELVKKFHPDNLQSKGLDDEFLQYANQRMQEINEAFEKLRRYYSNK